MKIDGRKLDRATQAHLRRQVVLAVRGGMTQAEASRVHGLTLRAVQRPVRGRARERCAPSRATPGADRQAKVRRIC